MTLHARFPLFPAESAAHALVDVLGHFHVSVQVAEAGAVNVNFPVLLLEAALDSMTVHMYVYGSVRMAVRVSEKMNLVSDVVVAVTATVLLLVLAAVLAVENVHGAAVADSLFVVAHAS